MAPLILSLYWDLTDISRTIVRSAPTRPPDLGLWVAAAASEVPCVVACVTPDGSTVRILEAVTD